MRVQVNYFTFPSLLIQILSELTTPQTSISAINSNSNFFRQDRLHFCDSDRKIITSGEMKNAE